MGLFMPRSFDYVSADLAAYPELLNRYSCSKPSIGISKPGSGAQRIAPRFAPVARSFTEAIVCRNRLGGYSAPDVKYQQDRMAIGDLRNAAESISRLHTVQSFGAKLVQAWKAALVTNLSECSKSRKLEDSWVVRACSAIFCGRQC